LRSKGKGRNQKLSAREIFYDRRLPHQDKEGKKRKWGNISGKEEGEKDVIKKN